MAEKGQAVFLALLDMVRSELSVLKQNLPEKRSKR